MEVKMETENQDVYLKELMDRSELNTEGIDIPKNLTMNEFIEFIKNIG